MDPVSRAQGNTANSAQYRGLRPFKPGQSGNPKGRPKKAPITKILEKIFSKPQNRKDIEEAVLRILLGGRMSSVLMIREAAERLEGKVSQEVEVHGNVNVTLEQVLEARKKAGK
jgi:Family of unknown function (DUF5681)